MSVASKSTTNDVITQKNGGHTDACMVKTIINQAHRLHKGMDVESKINCDCPVPKKLLQNAASVISGSELTQKTNYTVTP